MILFTNLECEVQGQRDLEISRPFQFVFSQHSNQDFFEVRDRRSLEISRPFQSAFEAVFLAIHVNNPGVNIK